VDHPLSREERRLGRLGRNDLTEARDCLKQLHGAQKERAIPLQADYAVALSDLAEACLKEARQLLL
jgi:hypothetical protein